MVWAEAMAAFSTTRKNSSARSVSMFCPKFLANALASVRTSVAIYESSRSGCRNPENLCLSALGKPALWRKTIAHHALYIQFGQARGEIHQGGAPDAHSQSGKADICSYRLSEWDLPTGWWVV